MARKARTRRGFGSIKVQRSGRFQASYIGPDLERHAAPSTFITREDASYWLTTEQRLIERDEWTSPKARAEAKRAEATANGLTLRTYSKTWLATRTRTANRGRGLAPRTVVEYQRYLDRLILPELGDLRLREITRNHVQTWTANLDPSTPRMNQHVHTLLKSILATAAEDEIIERTPLKAGDRIAPPTRSIGGPATLDEIEKIKATMPERLRLMVDLATWCAFRFGEVAELRRSDVNLKAGTIGIERAVQWVEGEKIVKEPKAGSVGVIAFPPHLKDSIEHHLDKHAQKGEDGLLFPTTNGGQYRAETFTKSFWRKARAAAGRPDLRFHDLRHTGNLLAAEAGATIAELMQRNRQKTMQAAMQYQHAAKGSDAKIAASLSKIAKAHAGEKASELAAFPEVVNPVTGELAEDATGQA